MHGIEPRKRERRTSRLSATLRTVFPSPQDQTPSDTPLAASRSGPDARNGFSLARNSDRLSAASIAGSKLPACHFASLPTWNSCPFGLSAPLPRSRFAPGCGRLNASGPLHFIQPVRPAAPTASTPLQDFGSLRIKAFSDVCCLPVRLANPPDLPSLPDALTFNSVGFGSSFRVRYVSAGLLFLKPLGTFFTMLPKAKTVNTFCLLPNAKSSINIWLVFRQLKGIVRGLGVDKTAVANPVLPYCNGSCAGLSYGREASGT
jgi:hypothetical protein